MECDAMGRPASGVTREGTREPLRNSVNKMRKQCGGPASAMGGQSAKVAGREVVSWAEPCCATHALDGGAGLS